MLKKKYKLKPLFKHQLLVTSISVFVVVVITVAGSLAIFSKTKSGNEYNKINVGKLELSYVDISDEGNVLQLNNEFPVSDEEGAAGNCYRFSVENTGTVTATYYIRIEDDVDVITADNCSNNLLDKTNIRYKFDNGDIGTLSDLKDNDYTLYSSTLQAGESNIHEIRVWISENSGNDVLGKHYHGRVVVDIEQQVNEGPLSEYVMALSTTNSDQIRVDTHSATGQQNFDTTEYRYYGANPNNYVSFNNELWRMIGVFDVDDGTGNTEKRVKIIRNESIGSYSWDSSESTINGGDGVNEWSQSKIMNTLNNGDYYNSTSGICYNGSNNTETTCDFTSIGLTDEAKLMIDDSKWYLGAGPQNYSSLTSDDFYTYERGTATGKICSTGDYCTDSVTRTTSWIGKIGLIYVSDYGYATDMNSCSTIALKAYNSTCKNTTWLYNGQNQWTLNPNSHDSYNNSVFINLADGSISIYNIYTPREVYPVTYLKSSIKITGGTGTADNPYTISQ